MIFCIPVLIATASHRLASVRGPSPSVLPLAAPRTPPARCQFIGEDAGISEDNFRLSGFPQMAAWVAETGGDVELVRADREANWGLGIVAARVARYGEVLLSVPEGAALTTESALRSSIGEWLIEFDPELADYAFIAMALLHERRLGPQSVFVHWLGSGCLPSVPDVPLTWPAAGEC